MAYANLAGFPPETGLYASMLPVVLYALFASSRQLVMGPDATTCGMTASFISTSLIFQTNVLNALG